jgi:DNA-binding NarL/FixJ family response regulator
MRVELPHFRVRRLRVGDFRSVARFIPRRSIGRDGNTVTIDGVGACERLLAAGMMLGAVVSQPNQPSESIVAFGGAVFLTDQYVRDQKTSSVPGLAERILLSAFSPVSPILDATAIERHNEKGGLNLAVLFHEWDRDCTDQDYVREIRIHLIKAFLNDMRGYRLREIIAECVGEEDVRWAVGGGGYVLRDSYDEWYRKHAEPAPRRYLVGATREEALALPSSVISLLFHYREPVCGFTPSERRLLQAALTCETDTEIASALEISPSSVKKRWAAIFERVGARIPELLKDAPRGLTRGPQKRHGLLAYLREHQEELRP